MIGKLVIWRGIECEVTDVSYSPTHRQDVAWLKAVKGEPFSRYSDGGPYMVDWTIVPVSFLLDQLSEGLVVHKPTVSRKIAGVLNGQEISQKYT